ncbi:hypothetical protein GW813_13645 [bacterium]|nr:hypothetical protein [bacterium]PJA74397.1 MAG: hypothetical protein CO151_09770 [bacterium CG_4_9_14_3_um_filter_65_15]
MAFRVRELVAGARGMRERCLAGDSADNPATLYAAVRNGPYRKGFTTEILGGFHGDLHSLGQYIQDGRRNLMETILHVQSSGSALTVPALADGADGLGYLYEKAVAVSGLMLEVNPFDQPGVETYKREMFRLLGKPE